MNIFTVCGFGIAASCAVTLIRRLRPELAEIAAAVSGILLLSYVIGELSPFVDYIRGIAAERGLLDYFALMLKALAISFCCKISSEICRGCGENTLASQLELAGKVGIVIISLPIITQLFEIAEDMLK